MICVLRRLEASDFFIHMRMVQITNYKILRNLSIGIEEKSAFNHKFLAEDRSIVKQPNFHLSVVISFDSFKIPKNSNFKIRKSHFGKCFLLFNVDFREREIQNIITIYN